MMAVGSVCLLVSFDRNCFETFLTGKIRIFGRVYRIFSWLKSFHPRYSNRIARNLNSSFGFSLSVDLTLHRSYFIEVGLLKKERERECVCVFNGEENLKSDLLELNFMRLIKCQNSKQHHFIRFYLMPRGWKFTNKLRNFRMEIVPSHTISVCCV